MTVGRGGTWNFALTFTMYFLYFGNIYSLSFRADDLYLVNPTSILAVPSGFIGSPDYFGQ